MSDRVRIFSRAGLCLADLRVTVERTWIINEEADGEFDIMITDPNCREDYLRFGNWLLVENDKLEPWVGYIDVPLKWGRRSLHVNAYTPERQLFYRNVPRQLKFSGKSGVIFKKIIDMCNRAESTVIELGDIWEGGRDMPEETLNGANFRDFIQDMVERAGAEYTFRPVVQNNRLRIFAEWREKIGVDTNFILEESYNLDDHNNSYSRDGMFVTKLWGYGNGSDLDSMPIESITDDESLSKYGLREGSKEYPDYIYPGSVSDAILNEIKRMRHPENIFQLSLLDVGASWNNMRTGNTYPIRMWSVGFGVNTRARVYGMYFDPLRGAVELKTMEVFDDGFG